MIKLNKLAILAAIVCGTPVVAAEGRQAYHESNEYDDDTVTRVGFLSGASHCDCGEAVCGCEMAASDPACGAEMMMSEPACGSELMSIPGCDVGEPGCGMDMSCASDSRGGASMGGILDQLECGETEEPWVLFGEACGWSAGGWVQFGYNNRSLPAFNNRADSFELHQGWAYAEKAVDTTNGFGVGGRIDYIYGTDGPNTQAFGTGERGWDNRFDNGPDNGGYGHAIPQAYFEAGYGDLKVKFGHFFTIIGYEVVQATGNFFYSNAYTFNFSEPFTHTGALGTYSVTEDITAYGGYVLGWDSGFDDNGDAYLGGISANVTEDLTLTYATVRGRFGDAPLGVPEKGYMHSVVANVNVTEKLNYVFQSDLLDSDNATGATVRETFGINQYLFYTLCDAAKLGTRFEWYDAKAGVLGTTSSDVYAWTSGINVTPHPNVTIRPEIRRDWIFGDRGAVLENGNASQTTFGIDTIFTF